MNLFLGNKGKRERKESDEGLRIVFSQMGQSDGKGSRVVWGLDTWFEWNLAAWALSKRRFYLSLWHLDGQKQDDEWSRKAHTNRPAGLLFVPSSPYLLKLLGFVLLRPFQEVEQDKVTEDCTLHTKLKSALRTDSSHWNKLVSSQFRSEIGTSPTEVKAATRLISVGIVSNFPAWRRRTGGSRVNWHHAETEVAMNCIIPFQMYVKQELCKKKPKKTFSANHPC